MHTFVFKSTSRLIALSSTHEVLATWRGGPSLWYRKGSVSFFLECSTKVPWRTMKWNTLAASFFSFVWAHFLCFQLAFGHVMYWSARFFAHGTTGVNGCENPWGPTLSWPETKRTSTFVYEYAKFYTLLGINKWWSVEGKVTFLVSTCMYMLLVYPKLHSIFLHLSLIHGTHLLYACVNLSSIKLLQYQRFHCTLSL